jgi:hypothetical protein
MGRTAFTEPQCLYKGALYLYLYLSDCNFSMLHFYAPSKIFEKMLLVMSVWPSFRLSVRLSLCQEQSDLI